VRPGVHEVIGHEATAPVEFSIVIPAFAATDSGSIHIETRAKRVAQPLVRLPVPRFNHVVGKSLDKSQSDQRRRKGYGITYKNIRQSLPLELSRTIIRLVNFQPGISSFTERTLALFLSWLFRNGAILPKDLGRR
jgi:hypothetical protein